MPMLGGRMLGGSYHHGDAAEEREHSLLWPERGGIRALLELALVYHLVVIATPLIVEQIRLLNPGVVPEPFTTILYASLWLGLGLVIAWLLLTESFVSTHRFEDRDGLEEHMGETSIDRRWMLTNGGLVVVGGALAVATYSGFAAAFLGVVDLLVIVVENFEWTLSVVDGLYIAGFLAGFLSFATGIDRLIVEGLRTYVRRQYDSSETDQGA